MDKIEMVWREKFGGGGVRLGYWTRLYVSRSGLARVCEFRVCLVGGFLSNFGVTTNTGGVLRTSITIQELEILTL